MLSNVAIDLVAIPVSAWSHPSDGFFDGAASAHLADSADVKFFGPDYKFSADRFAARWGRSITAADVAAVMQRMLVCIQQKPATVALAQPQVQALVALCAHLENRTPAAAPSAPILAALDTEPLVELWPAPPKPQEESSQSGAEAEADAAPEWRVYGKDRLAKAFTARFCDALTGAEKPVVVPCVLRYVPFSKPRRKGERFPGDVLDAVNLMLDYVRAHCPGACSDFAWRALVSIKRDVVRRAFETLPLCPESVRMEEPSIDWETMKKVHLFTAKWN